MEADFDLIIFEGINTYLDRMVQKLDKYKSLK